MGYSAEVPRKLNLHFPLADLLHFNMPLLSLSSELLVGIAEYVADADTEADGDIVAFAIACRLSRSLLANAVKEYLPTGHVSIAVSYSNTAWS